MNTTAVGTKALFTVLWGVLVAVLLPGKVLSAAADPAAQYYQAAKNEAKLVIYGLGEPFLGPIKAAFTKRYPGIQVEAFDESGRETRERIIAEQKTNRPVGDVVIAGASVHQTLGDLGFLQPYRSSHIPSFIPELVPEGTLSSPFRSTVFSIATNTKLVPASDEPTVWADLLHPRFKGKMASDDPRGSGGGGGLMASLELAFTTEFLRKLATQEIFFGKDTGTILAGLVRGEHALFITASHDDIIVARKGGAPVKFVKLSDGIRAAGNYQSIVKNAPHLNAAKLWVEWSTSEEGQTLLGKVGLAAARKGIKAAEPEADLTGLKLLPVAQGRQDMNYLKERTKRYEEIFFKKK
jgi:iron(III) transport system substrate-binding protein